MTDFSYHGHDNEHDVVTDVRAGLAIGPFNPTAILYVGACCGYEAGQLAERFQAAAVHVVEACKESYDAFLAGPRPCCPQPNIVAVNTAMAGEVGTATLHLVGMNTCHSLLRPLDHGLDSTREVATTTIARYCQEAGIRPEIVVLDTEGLALRIIRAAGGYLDSARIILAETEPAGANVFEGGDTDEDFAGFVETAGFTRIYSLHTGPRQFNSLWVRQP